MHMKRREAMENIAWPNLSAKLALVPIAPGTNSSSIKLEDDDDHNCVSNFDLSVVDELMMMMINRAWKQIHVCINLEVTTSDQK